MLESIQDFFLFKGQYGNVSIAKAMPEKLTSHAMVAINDTACLVTGGWRTYGKISKLTYIYDIEHMVWEFGPMMNNAREGHGSTILVDRSLTTALTFVVVAGGWNGYKRMASVEMLQLPYHENKWKIGESFYLTGT